MSLVARRGCSLPTSLSDTSGSDALTGDVESRSKITKISNMTMVFVKKMKGCDENFYKREFL